MSQTSELRGAHALQFYESDSELVAAVVPYLAAGVHEGEALVVVAEDVHRHEFEAGLDAAGIDLEEARATGMFASLDAVSTLSALMPAGELDECAFDEVVGDLLRRTAQRASGIRAYGEMVALLWRDGDVAGAIELERLWNELVGELDLSLFCAYPAASVDSARQLDELHEVCELHSVIVPSTSGAASAARAERIWFAPELESCTSARLFVRSTLRRWGYAGGVVDSAAVAATELATNSVVHARSKFSVEICAEEDTLRIAVSDDVPAPATVWRVQAGRGLSIIDALCNRWGATAGSEGKTVWAELSAGAAR